MRLHQLLERKAQSNASFVTLHLLKSLQVAVTATSVIESLEHHPDYPSLYSISDSLQKWKVDNLALKVKAEALEQLPTPFIAHSKYAGGNFVLVNNVNGAVDYIDEKGKRRQKSKEEFNKEWDNIVLLAEKNNDSGEKNFATNRKKELLNNLHMPIIVTACLLLIIFYGITTANLYATILLSLKFAGAIIAGILLWFEVDKSNPVLRQICSAGKNTNCTAVLSSKQSKLFNLISWSEIGFFYFAGSFLYLLLSANYHPDNHRETALSVLSWLNLFALPYTIFSIFYQWRIAKQWCPLCLAVQAILLLEFITCYFGYWHTNRSFNFSTNQLLPLVTSFLLPVFFWIATKKAYLTAQEGKRYQKDLSKLKYNKEVFQSLLVKQKAVTVSPEGLGITLGNPNAKNTIIKVCNPYCGPCAKAHPIIDEILDNNNDVKVQIIFNAKNDDNDKKAKPVKHFMALHEKNNNELIEAALHDWYSADKKDYDTFAAKYLLNGELELQGKKLEAMDKWCKEIGISFTPTFFVNGYQLPEAYSVNDLKHLL